MFCYLALGGALYRTNPKPERGLRGFGGFVYKKHPRNPCHQRNPR